jgi:hypothetical protein
MHTPEPLSSPLDTAALRHQLTTSMHQYTARYADHDADQQGPGPPESLGLQHLCTIPLDLHAEIDTLLHPSNHLIDSPRRMTPAQLQPFVHGSTALRLVFPDKTAHPALLRSLHPTFLIAETPSAVGRLQTGGLVLVVFPSASRPHYVLQTVIQDQSAARLHLAYGDPRYDVRHRVQLAAPVALYLTPPTLGSALRSQQIRIVRDLYGPPTGTFPSDGGAIIEHPCATEAAGAASDVLYGREAAGHTCQLHDISLGGVCLALPSLGQTETLRSRLIYLDIHLPLAQSCRPGDGDLALRLQLFGLVRGIRTTPAPGTLHIRFLKRLPAELDACFGALASDVGQ